MADLIGKVFKAASASASAVTDDDFADFATASPAVAAPAAESAATISPLSFASNTPLGAPAGFDSPWYAVWERHSLSEFRTEGYIILLIIFIVGIHMWGARRNRSIAAGFIAAIAPVLTKEFALVGFSEQGKPNTLDNNVLDADAAIQENTQTEYVSYASGRQNIQFMHTTIKLQKRHNPVAWMAEIVFAFFFDAMPQPTDTITMTIAPFDGGEPPKAASGSSKYDNFIWAIVNKRCMKKHREERYDLSLTRTSDWEGLPNWAAVMGESKEVGDMCLYQQLKDVIPECSDFLEYLIVSDMPKEKPSKLADYAPRKRITLELTMPSDSTNPEALQRLVSAFIRLVDHLVANAHFRPEVLRKVKATRDDEQKKLKRSIEDETKEERETKLAEKKKADRDAKLRGMSAAEQKKFLEKEREKERKDMMKKMGRKQ
ncbi:hypothetical protein BZA77DRAFT_15489 [Pyronema omphalodes]|nr:hypothetical protein BZA77DRAFT_15489 [Pyronema omphalodes]